MEEVEEVDEVRFVASNLGLSVKGWKKTKNATCCQQSGLECQKKEEVEEVEEMRFVASNLGLSVKDWKKWKKCRKYHFSPSIWA